MAELRDDVEFLEASRRDECLLELRLDQYSDLSAANLEATLRTFGSGKVLVTHRSPEEGGRNAGATDRERFYYLSQATSLGAAFIDVELTTLRRTPDGWRALRAARQHDTRFIVSFHDFKGCPAPAELRMLRREAEEVGGDVVKFAVSAATIFDSLPLLELLNETGWRRPFLGLVMGEAGFWSRVLGPRFPTPSPFTFARGCQAPGTAPGQPTWRELITLYRFPRIQPDWPIYGVIGDPIAHSLSPLMQNSALSEAQLPGVHLPFRVVGDASAFVREMAPKLGLEGIVVDIPHKEAVCAACARCDELVQQIGAADTLTRCKKDGPAEWEAVNTEASAVAAGLEEALGGENALRDRTIVILGSGGLAKAVAFGAKARGANLLIWDRTIARAQELSAAVGAKSVLKEELTADLEAVAVVNATSKGMQPKVDESPLGTDSFPNGSLFLDMGYSPFETSFLKMARAAGGRSLDGLSMLIGRTAAQFEAFTGRAAPRASMRRVVEAEILRRTGGA